MKQIILYVNLSLLFLIIMSCNQNPSKIEKDYIKNLEEKNRILEKELQEEKNKIESTSTFQRSKKGNKISRDYFTIGSTEDEVIKVMGDPTSYIDLGSSGKLYHYGISSVSFENGKVESYNNLEGNLKVKVKN